MRAVVTDEGEEVYVAETNGDTGSKGPFLVAYGSRDRDARYGWFCANCDTIDTAMDPMGRIQCNACGNLRKATEWDAAHE